MNILFLDVDGVLNSKQYFLATPKLSQSQLNSSSDPDLLSMKTYTNKNNMWCLGYLLENVPDLKIVISSAWRNCYSLESFRELFKIYGLDGNRIIDKTSKRLSSIRANEIYMWLEDNKGIEKWIALDDHTIFELGDLDKANEILTDNWVGLTMHETFKIIKHFNPDFKEPVIAI